MDDCEACRIPLFFRSFAAPAPATLTSTRLEPQAGQRTELLARDSKLMRDAFAGELDRSCGLGDLHVETAELRGRDDQPLLRLEDVALQRYRQPQANCLAVGLSHGIRGAVVGSVFGGAMALSTAVQSGYRGSSAVSYAGMGAMRNAAGFASWTSLYGFSRCGLIRMRRTHDLLNPTIAGGFTGGVLTLISSRGHWRYNQSTILANAAGSAMVAVMFEALSYM